MKCIRNYSGKCLIFGATLAGIRLAILDSFESTLLWESFYAKKYLYALNIFFSFFSEIPIWLRVYFKASPTLDHHLKWELFRLPELECFEGMLSRLFREELEDLVRR